MTKDIKKPTLAEKQAFWAEQMPIFKEHYIMQAELDVLYFDNESGNFEIKDEAAIDFEKEDFLETYHSVNTGWSMWLRATTLATAKLEGCVVVPVKTPDQFTSKLEDHLLELWIGDWGCDWDGFVSVNGIKPENIWSMVVEAARGGNENT